MFVCKIWNTRSQMKRLDQKSNILVYKILESVLCMWSRSFDSQVTDLTYKTISFGPLAIHTN